jgi:hypothetical protein
LLRDKLLLILSKNAIAKIGWRTRSARCSPRRNAGRLAFFPVRIDETVVKSDEPWAVDLRGQRNIGDFRRWKENDAYKQAFSRILRDLKATPG